MIDPKTAEVAAEAAVSVSQKASGSAASKPRIAVWDNARFVLIALVVIGHTISTVRTDSDFAFGLYAYIYLFHMPAMILLSGMFSRTEVNAKAFRGVVQLIVLWLVWEGIWAILNFWVEGRPLGKNFLVSPAWTLWFIVTLVTMRILLPYIARLRHPLMFSIAIALIAGLSPEIGSQFSASRTLCFFPFFVAGWLIRDRGVLDGAWFMSPARAARATGWALLGAIGIAFLLVPQLRSEWRIDKWLTWRDSYGWLFANAPLGDWKPSEWFAISGGGIVVAASLLLLAGAMTLALLLVVPRRASVITVWGSRTLFVYLLHGPVVWVLRETGSIAAINSLTIGPISVGVPVMILGAVVLTMLLSMTWVTRAFKPIIEPSVDWMLQRPSH
ncbi:acyltransferase family protein [Leucobacter insecticola]|uniref:Acyltransferase family protein n=2 Tax=Leucobacter insecticola TaxID=2714934 RepID=A0A6G8FLS9_9MICO|nr:acyltransferase family protein [Leucobacter insecticola]